ncbi:putative alpha,alpha-trehalose-phosphate synthase [UDP-forming] 9 [Gossypium australe]|uniref:Putative alpha,alpha-trehalose-phosphate synthase [UDP-forming] 9 n=1 Tax=Gossypium australe TaxID=47621 RepID=A0A5B6WH46_9ROSI|nr:putative alpha,alpha-trehalose-phosphate synthase [UDP-forming] 9 [Gossypium australe]
MPYRNSIHVKDGQALQRIAGANATLARQGFPLEHLRALGGKEFRGVRDGDPTRPKYWLDDIIRILGQMGCSHKDKLGCAVLLLTNKANRWWLTIERGTVPNRLTWDFFLSLFWRKFMSE